MKVRERESETEEREADSATYAQRPQHPTYILVYINTVYTNTLTRTH